MFAFSHPSRFKLPGRNKKTGSGLTVDGTIITDQPYILEAWANHFSTLAQSKATDNSYLAELKASIESLILTSMDNKYIYIRCSIYS